MVLWGGAESDKSSHGNIPMSPKFPQATTLNRTIQAYSDFCATYGIHISDNEVSLSCAVYTTSLSHSEHDYRSPNSLWSLNGKSVFLNATHLQSATCNQSICQQGVRLGASSYKVCTPNTLHPTWNLVGGKEMS